MYLYPISYTDQDVAKAREPITITAAKKQCVAVKAPPNGRVKKIVVWQKAAADGGGTAVDFEVELFDCSIPFPAGEYDVADAAADTLDAYRILVPPDAPLTATAGNVASLVTDNDGLMYRNKDGSYSSAQEFIYLLITPIDAAGATVWYITIHIHVDKGASG